MQKLRSLLSVFLVILTHWKRKPLQLLLILVGLSTATALWATVHLINVGAQKSFNEAQQLLNQISKESIQSINGDFFSEDFFVALISGWSILFIFWSTILLFVYIRNEPSIVTFRKPSATSKGDRINNSID